MSDSTNTTENEEGIILCDRVLFWDLIDDLSEEYYDQWRKTGLYRHRVRLLGYLQKGELYVQKTNIKDDKSKLLYDRLSTFSVYKKDDSVKLWHNDIIPAFCVYNKEESIVFIWTRKDWRRKGIARKFVQHFGVKYVTEILEEKDEFWKDVDIERSEESRVFWRKVGVKYSYTLKQ